MSTWYPSWFSGLPSFDFSLPSAIQRRFLSFVLKKSLGHFLKPGQLDLHQIDSQIGSGVVQVRDLELDDQAINKLLAGSPFRLHDGSISCVTARIPFPNPLTSSVGLSVQSLHLTLHATPPSDLSSPNSVNLAQSVASVAETFIHGELTPREEATLRESLHPDSRPQHAYDEGHHLPGGLDSSTRVHPQEEIGIDSDPSGVSLFATLFEHLLARFEFSAADTKIVIVHPGHSSFTLSIPEIAYSTDSSVPKRQSTGDEPSSNVALERSTRNGHTRIVSISGVTITSRDIRATLQNPVTSPRTMSPVSLTSSHVTLHDHQQAPRPVSPASSYSSIDEDTQMMMSQSIVALPPRSQFRASPSSSVLGSMYQSAVSTAGCSSTIPLEPLGNFGTGDITQPRSCDHIAGNRESAHVPHWATEDLVFSVGADPIVVRLQTPPDYTKHDVAHPSTLEIVSPHTENIAVKQDETLCLSVSVGIMSCALRACHVRMLLEMLNYCGSKNAGTTPQHPETTPSPPTLQCGLHASLNIRGIVTLVITEALDQEVPSLEAFFQSPLIPPRLPSTYLRVLLENVTGSLDLSGTPGNKTDATYISPITSNILLSNLSVFMYHTSRTVEKDAAQLSLPLLITDHRLHNQYIVSHCRPFFSSTTVPAQPLSEVTLPTFEVVDWTAVKLAGGSSKLSTWRVKSSTGKDQLAHSPPSKFSAFPTSPKPPTAALLSEEELKELSLSSAITFTARVTPATTRSGGLTDILVRIAPLHVFFDVDIMLEGGGVLKFLDEVLAVEGSPTRDASDTFQGRSSLDDTEEEDSASDDELNTPFITPKQLERERERRRLERLVLEDLDLDIDYRTGAPARQRPHSKRVTNTKHKPKSKQTSHPKITIILPALRAEVRCRSPSLQPSRSGGIILDLHDVQVSNKPLDQESPTIRFGDVGESRNPSVKNLPGQLLSGQIKGIVLSYAPVGDSKAHAFISLGSLPRTDDVHPGSASLLLSEQAPDSLPIRFQLTQVAPSKAAVSSSMHRTSIIINVPLVNVVLEKPVFDGLQIWADSVTQVVATAAEETETEVAQSRNPSLIGSRFFAKSRRVGSRGSDESSFGTIAPTPKQSETAVKVIIAEALVRILISRSQTSAPSIRPFDISASDIDVLVELKPDGKDETVITSSLMDLHVGEVSPKWELVPLLVLTLPRSLSSVPRPMVKARFASLVVPETGAKETKIRLALWGFTCHVYPNLQWISDLARFIKAPPGVFESVVPSERTSLSFAIVDVSIKTYAPSHPGSAVLYIGEAELNTELAGNSSEFKFKLLVPSLSFLLVDSMADAPNGPGSAKTSGGSSLNLWKNFGFASIADIEDLDLVFKTDNACVPPSVGVLVNHVSLRLHICADTIAALAGYMDDFTSIFKSPSPAEPTVSRKKAPASLAHRPPEQGMMASLDEQAFRRIPDVGNAADMINDDLPTNLDYLDESFGSAAGLRELRDDDLEDFDVHEDGRITPVAGETGVVSKVGGETIRIIKPIHPIEHYYDTIPPENTGDLSSLRDTILRVRIHDSDVSLFLHDGYDWPRTRKIVEQEIKDMRKKLAKIKQLIATGQTQDPSVEETSTMLFNSIHIGLDQDFDSLDPTALVAAIDDELENAETESHSSWQTLPPASPGQQQRMPSTRIHGRRLTRSKGPSIEIKLIGLDAEVDSYRHRLKDALVSKTLVVIKNAEILDHVKTSTWRKFLTELRSDSRGNIRETDSSMVRVELKTVQPSPSHPSEETRLRAKLLPLRLYVDQDALDFLKKFFAFKDPDSPSAPADTPSEETYIQHAEVFPIDLKLDYKPRRVDYRALREGKTIELMNFFHFDGAEMTLRHLTLHGITGWPRFFDTLNDLWTPDVKATQLVDVISGVAPIRSMVNVGSGVADLVLLPIAQYKKDGRIVRGVQKGTKAFVQSTAMEAIKLGARLATGTQVILEQTESVLGGQFKDSITAETFHIPYDDSGEGPDEELISRYAAQPADVTEGVQSAYRSLQRNLHSAAQTILAVPMEVYEKSGNEGAVRAVVRAVPIAVLKPMIGASEAVSKTLMGLHNTLDPNVRHENAAKYKHR
ncbi:hypothetical protein DFJ58DRAFT_753708 [Suillus subalutaceus]|uniref:uncharacterized protein n=1 Tax=Suillus subalutaceus TaxID=48586 RepID=UPI001B86874C|nr:uncharacterized protein DFJ58DRAFT_753708 [Suillus subalutaceus]KAG1878016.1 hypothetical protein DFJ58DRAFT_753708 [Suillus subalutaceus]